MTPRLHIVASCTLRKRLSVPPELHLGSVPSQDLGQTATEWCRRLARSESPVMPAAELYAGDHWSVVRTLPSIAGVAGFATDLAIVSAGYGLVFERASLHGY